MLEPTEPRIQALDVIRGIALLGILLADLVAFSTPFASAQLASVLPPRAPSQVLFDSLSMAFVNGKFRTMLAVLLGVGVWLQYERRTSIPKGWPWPFVKRTGILLIIGLAHGYLIWYGDMLSLFAVLATMAALLMNMKETPMRWIFGLLIGNAVVTTLVLVPLLLWFVHSGEAKEWDFGMYLPFFSPQYEMLAYQSGTWLQQEQLRATYYSISLLAGGLFGPILLPLVLWGVQLGKVGVLSAPSQHPRLRNWVLAIAFGVGLPLSLIAFMPWESRDAATIRIAFEFLLGPLLGIGYLMLAAMWAESRVLRWLQTGFAVVGRMPLSIYLLQSAACTVTFYSWGLDLFGKLSPTQLIGVFGWISLLQVAFASLWFRYFRLGPAEWLWRSLAEGRPLRLVQRNP